MGERYTLRDVGFPYKHIMRGRTVVGRVFRHKGDGLYVGIIGKTERRSSTERGAFEAIVAADLGFTDAAALNEHKAEVRTANRAARARARHLVNDMMSPDRQTRINAFDRLGDMMGLPPRKK